MEEFFNSPNAEGSEYRLLNEIHDQRKQKYFLHRYYCDVRDSVPIEE